MQKLIVSLLVGFLAVTGLTLGAEEGQIRGDTIKGTVEKKSWSEENRRYLDWEAKRVKE